jgi:hypothetical protein
MGHSVVSQVHYTANRSVLATQGFLNFSPFRDVDARANVAEKIATGGESRDTVIA